jgi:F420H(2)-dependent quinone reductase
MPSPRRLVYLAVGSIVTTRPVSAFHRSVLRRSGGRLLSRPIGYDIALLTTTGRRTGRARTVPLTAFADGDAIIVVGSNGGRRHHPAWLLNLRDDPRVEVEIRGRSWPGRAREVDPDADPRRWSLVTYGGYAVYRERTPRSVPLVVIEPDAGDRAGGSPDGDPGWTVQATDPG